MDARTGASGVAEVDQTYLPPLQHLQPRGRGVQFGLGAILPHSNTPARNASRSDAGGPSLRVAGFDDEDEDEAPRSNKWIVQLVGHFRETLSQKIELVLFKMAAEQIDDQVPIDRPCFLELGFAFARDLYNQPAGILRAIQLRYQALCCHPVQTAGQGATRKHNFPIDVAKSHFAFGSMAQVEQDVVESERHQPLRFKLPLD
jgi:hypothetical protein